MPGLNNDKPSAPDHATPSARESHVRVDVTADTSAVPHKAGEARLYVMYDAADPGGGKLYFTEAEWEAFIRGVKDGEFDRDESE